MPTVDIPFEEPPAARLGRLGRIEPAVHWLTQSTRPEAIKSRATVNDWYRGFPDLDGRFLARLRSEIDADHYQAIDELYVHRLLTANTGDVRYEEAKGAPDFRVYSGGSLAASVEVASLFEQSSWTEEGKRHARLADAVDARLRPSKGYFVDFQIERTDHDPVPRNFIAWLSRKFEELPEITETSRPSRTDASLGPYNYVDGTVWITVSFIPMRWNAASRTDPDASIVGMGQAIGGMVRAGKRLHDRISDKAGGRYDLGDAPFLVAVGVHDLTCSDDQTRDAIYGRHTVSMLTGDVSRGDGALFAPSVPMAIPRNGRLSAVAVIRNLATWRSEQADVVVVENPHARHPWSTPFITPTRPFVAD